MVSLILSVTDKLFPTHGKTILLTYPLMSEGLSNNSSLSFLKAYWVNDFNTTGSSFLSLTF